MDKLSLIKKVEKQQNEAKEFGFDWQYLEQLTDQIRSEAHEVDEAWKLKNMAHLQEEIGDLIHAALSLSVFCGFDPEETLKKSVDKFQRRYDALVDFVQEDGHENLLHNESYDVMMGYWKKAKIATDP